MVDGLLNGVAGDDLAVFLEMVVTHPKFLRSTIFKRPLVVEDELLHVVRLQRSQDHLWFVAHVGNISDCKITEVAAGGWQTNQPLNVTFQSKTACFW